MLASHFTRVSQTMSKCFCSTIVLIARLILLNAFVYFSSQSSFFGVFDVEFVRSGRSGSDKVAKLGMNLTKWCMLHMNDLSCVSVFGFSSWMMASVFSFVGVIPSELILYPNQTIYVSPISHLCRLIARFSLSSQFNVVSISFSCWSSVPFDIIIYHL